MSNLNPLSFITAIIPIRALVIATALFSLVGSPAAISNDLLQFNDLTPGWNTLIPGGVTRCATGTPYSFHVKPGTQSKLMVFLNGGGGCWTGDACDVNTEPTPYVPLATLPHNDPRTRDGVFALDNPENPFRDWSQVFVSYCSGDVHLGANDVEYTKTDGSTVTIHHRGKANMQSVLDWVYKNFSKPSRIVISGGSAGAIAAPYYSAILAEQYQDAEIIHFSGGAGGFRVEPQTEILNNLGILRDMADWPELAQYNVNNFLFDDLYLVAAARHPEIRFHQFNTSYDSTQEYFLQLLGVKSKLYPLLMANLADLKAVIPNFKSYTAAGDFHTILRFVEFYQYETAGVRTVDWVRWIAEGRPVNDVTCGSAQTCKKIAANAQ